MFGLFLMLVIVNKATVIIPIQVFVWTYVFTSLKEMPRRGMVGSYGKCVFNFVGTILHSHK